MIDTFLTLAFWGFALGFGWAMGVSLYGAIQDVADAFMQGFRRGRAGRGQ